MPLPHQDRSLQAEHDDEPGAVGKAGTLPTHSLMMLHKLTLFSACAGLGRPCLRSGAGSSACSQSGGSCHLRPRHGCSSLSPPSRVDVVQPHS